MKSKLKKMFEFIVKSTNGMAYGLFATLIIGTIISAISEIFCYSSSSIFQFIYEALNGTANVLKNLTGAGIGIGIAFSLKKDTLSTISLAIVGELASFFSLSTSYVTSGTINIGSFKIGDPLTIYFVVISVLLVFDLILKKKTPVDIILIPLVTVLLGLIFSLLLRYPTIYITYFIQWVINEATLITPFFMGIVIAVLMGMALTAPISSAAIASVIFVGALPGSGLALASGAAVVGCSTQMIGFAVQSIRDNNFGKVLSVGIGTSMLQFKNILKKPLIWLPTIITSAILGPIATTLLKVECLGSDAGMGTAGLVGQIGTLKTMGFDKWQAWISVLGLEIILPLILVYIIDKIFRKCNLIQKGDLTI